MSPNETKWYLLSIIELGGYPNFTSLYKQQGYDVEIVRSVRKALNAIKKRRPNVIIAEFNFQSDFRDRTSSLESLLAVIQQHSPETKVIIFFDQQQIHHFEKINDRLPIYASFPFPIDGSALSNTLAQISMID